MFAKGAISEDKKAEVTQVIANSKVKSRENVEKIVRKAVIGS